MDKAYLVREVKSFLMDEDGVGVIELSVTFLVVWKIREARVNAVLPIVSRFMSFWRCWQRKWLSAPL